MPERLRAELERISRQQNKAVSDVVRDSLRRYVAIEKFRALTKKVFPFAEAQRLVRDEDVFKAISSRLFRTQTSSWLPSVTFSGIQAFFGVGLLGG
jgi:predicted transcriptional regulator